MRPRRKAAIGWFWRPESAPEMARLKDNWGMRLTSIQRFSIVGLFLLATAGLAWLALSRDVPADHPGDPVANVSLASLDTIRPILPLPPLPPLSPERVALGRQLFADRRFSADGTLSCSSCHDLGRGGTDGRRFSVGIGGAVGNINAPTVFNSGLSFVQFWDGRAATLEEQAAGPIHNPIELGSNWAQVLERLGRDADMVDAFALAYPDGLNANNVADAIATFERSLQTPNSRFDRYLQGQKQVLTASEIDGYRRFREYGCVSCHQGALVGGNMFQKFGVLGDYFAGRPLNKSDFGRFNVTQREEDRHVFKVPSLRNVALTAPYFHDGSVETLDEAVRIMGRYQLGRRLSDEDVKVIVAFLKTLNGEWQGALLK